MLPQSVSRDDARGAAAKASERKLSITHLVADNIVASLGESANVEQAGGVLEDDCARYWLANARASADVVHYQEWNAIQECKLNITTAMKVTTPWCTDRFAIRSNFLRPITQPLIVPSMADALHKSATTITVNKLVDAHMMQRIKAAIEHVLALETRGEHFSQLYVAPVVKDCQIRISADTTVLMLQQLSCSLIPHDMDYARHFFDDKCVLFWSKESMLSNAAHDSLFIHGSDFRDEFFEEEHRVKRNKSQRMSVKLSQDAGKDDLKCVAALRTACEDDRHQSDGAALEGFEHTRREHMATSRNKGNDRSEVHARIVAQQEDAATLTEKGGGVSSGVAKDIWFRGEHKAMTMFVKRVNPRKGYENIRHALDPGLKYERNWLAAIATMKETRQSPKVALDRANAHAQLGRQYSLLEKGTAQEAVYARTMVQHMTLNVGAVKNIVRIIQLHMRGDRASICLHVQRHFSQQEHVAAHGAERPKNVVQHNLVAVKGTKILTHSLTQSIWDPDVDCQVCGESKQFVRKTRLQLRVIASNAVQKERLVHVIALQKELNHDLRNQVPYVVCDGSEFEGQKVLADKPQKNDGRQQLGKKMNSAAADAEKTSEALLAENYDIERLPLFNGTIGDLYSEIELPHVLTLLESDSAQERRECIVQAIERQLQLEALECKCYFARNVMKVKRMMRGLFNHTDITRAMQSIELSQVPSLLPIETEKSFFTFGYGGLFDDRAWKDSILSNQIPNKDRWTPAETQFTCRTTPVCASNLEYAEIRKQIFALIEAFQNAADLSREQLGLTLTMVEPEHKKSAHHITWSDSSRRAERKPHITRAKGVIEIEDRTQLVEYVAFSRIAALTGKLLEIVDALKKMSTLILVKQRAVDNYIERTAAVIKRAPEIKRIVERPHAALTVGKDTQTPKPTYATQEKATVDLLQLRSLHESISAHEFHLLDTTTLNKVQLFSIGAESVSPLRGTLVATLEYKASNMSAKRWPIAINAQLQADIPKEDAEKMKEATGSADVTPVDLIFDGYPRRDTRELPNGPLLHTTQFQEDDWELISAAASDEGGDALAPNSLPMENKVQSQQQLCCAFSIPETSQQLAQRTRPSSSGSNWRPFRRIAQKIRRTFQKTPADLS